MEHHELAIRFHRARRGRTLAVVRRTTQGEVRWARIILPVPPEAVAACAVVVDAAWKHRSQSEQG